MGDEHIAGAVHAGRRSVADGERSDSDKPAVGPDEGGSAVQGMGGNGEDGVLQQVFPIAGEGAPRGDVGRAQWPRTAEAYGEHRIALAQVQRGAQPERLGGQRFQGRATKPRPVSWSYPMTRAATVLPPGSKTSTAVASRIK